MFIPMIKYDPNNIERSSTMYVIDEFEKIPNIWMYGVPALIERSTKLTLSLRQKHLYCTSMYGLCFYICCPNKNNLMMQCMIKLIKFMVGSLSRETNKSLTHMITTSSLAKGYNYCLTFNKPMLHPDWIKECWRNRHKIGCTAVSITVNFQLKAFVGLGIYFTGPDPVQIEEMKEYAITNGGEAVHFEDTEWTHMAVNKDLQGSMGIEEIPLHIQYVIHSEWFNYGNYLGRRAFEDSIFQVSSLRKTKWTIENNVNLHRSRKDFETIVISSDSSEDEELS